MCEKCAQVKIRRAATPSKSDSSDVPKFPTDLKDVPLKSFQGYRYCLAFVDHYSRLSLAYYLRSKKDVSNKLHQYHNEMRKLALLFDRCSLTEEHNSSIKKAMILKSVPKCTRVH